MRKEGASQSPEHPLNSEYPARLTAALPALSIHSSATRASLLLSASLIAHQETEKRGKTGGATFRTLKTLKQRGNKKIVKGKEPGDISVGHSAWNWPGIQSWMSFLISLYEVLHWRIIFSTDPSLPSCLSSFSPFFFFFLFPSFALSCLSLWSWLTKTGISRVRFFFIFWPLALIHLQVGKKYSIWLREQTSYNGCLYGYINKLLSLSFIQSLQIHKEKWFLKKKKKKNNGQDEKGKSSYR